MEVIKKTPEYEDLKEMPFPPMGITYGPLNSRRLGKTLGINLLGAGEKICSFNCAYCNLGLTRLTMSEMKKFSDYPSIEAIDSHIRQAIVVLSKDSEENQIQTLTISGNGEPTLYPNFLEAIQAINKIRDELCPSVKINVLTNGSNFDTSKVIKGLNLCDDVMVKLDAGNDQLLKNLASPLVRFTTGKLVQGIKKIPNVTLQSLFVQGAVDNTLPNEVEDWIELVGIIKPKSVHIYSLEEVPPQPGLKQAPSQRLKEISVQLQKRTSIKGIVFS